MRLLAIFAALALLLGGGGLVYRSVAPPQLEAAAQPGEADESAPQRVALDLLIIPAIDGGRALFQVRVALEVEVAGRSAGVRLRDGLPRLRDAYLTELIGLYALEIVRTRPDDPAFLRRRLLAAGERALGPGVVQDILFRGIVRG